MGSYCVSEIERAGWVRRSIIQEAACLTFVRGGNLGQVAEAFGAIVACDRELDVDEFCEEAFANQEKHPMIALKQLGDWVLVLEDSGQQGRRPEVLRRVAETEAVSVFWDGSGLTRFSHAVRGQLSTAFEAVLPEIREGADPDALEQLRVDLPWSQADPVALMLVLAGRITGLPPSPGWLAGRLRTFPVAPWPDDLVAVSDPLEHVAGYPAELISALRSAGEQPLRQAAAAVARQVIVTADCVDHPVLRRTTCSLSTGAPVDHGELAAAVRELSWQSVRSRPCSKIRAHLRAAEAVRLATHDDPLTALTGVLGAARQVRGLEIGELAGIVAAELAG
ncbi:hypothetical protein SAMN02982929_02655 [Saccharopolyspora kobensis]|uniref:Uncharacterized protein n=1 Tax=Saccharopolyspora kobensis TaxID=146035 RepID=A0A1H6BKG0_9PSEU|nr:DUF6461 domain-containing protein [Saccharopolyspora kobensis]SEG61122.1 hypothetical protein SAMN02982929_02655 [Saccharopolyspora kobensis]SFE87363.1 hypothetical protein SAMN05216506_115110 [Saccharopolyspora kobensis]